jgi:hypothetical protein
MSPVRIQEWMTHNVACFNRARSDHLRGEHAHDIHYPIQLIKLINSTKQWLPSVHLNEHTTKRPDIDLLTVWQSQQHLWGAIKSEEESEIERVKEKLNHLLWMYV